MRTHPASLCYDPCQRQLPEWTNLQDQGAHPISACDLLGLRDQHRGTHWIVELDDQGDLTIQHSGVFEQFVVDQVFHVADRLGREGQGKSRAGEKYFAAV